MKLIPISNKAFRSVMKIITPLTKKQRYHVLRYLINFLEAEMGKVRDKA